MKHGPRDKVAGAILFLGAGEGGGMPITRGGGIPLGMIRLMREINLRQMLRWWPAKAADCVRFRGFWAVNTGLLRPIGGGKGNCLEINTA